MTTHEQVLAEERAVRKQHRALEKARRVQARQREKAQERQRRAEERQRRREVEKIEHDYEASLIGDPPQLSVVYSTDGAAAEALRVWRARGIRCFVAAVTTRAGRDGWAVMEGGPS